MPIDPPSPKSSSEPKRWWKCSHCGNIAWRVGDSREPMFPCLCGTVMRWIEVTASGEPVKEEKMELKVGKRYRRGDDRTVRVIEESSLSGHWRCDDGLWRFENGRRESDSETIYDLIEELPDEQSAPTGGASEQKAGRCPRCGDGMRHCSLASAGPIENERYTLWAFTCGHNVWIPDSATPSSAKPDAGAVTMEEAVKTLEAYQAALAEARREIADLQAEVKRWKFAAAAHLRDECEGTK